MATNYNPSIVIDGLRFCLDAANTKSYPGSGTTWTDLSGKNHDGTLTNGPTFSSDNGGSIVFDGSNDHISSIGTATNLGISNISSHFCFSVWFKTTGTSEYYMFDNWDGGVQDISFRLDNRQLEVYMNSGNTYAFANRFGNFNLGAWNQAVYSWNGSTKTITCYINGENVGSASASSMSGDFESDTSFTIGKRPGGGGQFPGSMACVMLYNKSLTEAEVKQNYNALKGRFGL